MQREVDSERHLLFWRVNHYYYYFVFANHIKFVIKSKGVAC